MSLNSPQSIIDTPKMVIDIQTINAFVICLKRKPVSHDNMQSWKAVFPNTHIYEAVDGNNIDIENDERVHALARMHITCRNSVANDSIFSVPTRGAIGCFLSPTPPR